MARIRSETTRQSGVTGTAFDPRSDASRLQPSQAFSSVAGSMRMSVRGRRGSITVSGFEVMKCSCHCAVARCWTGNEKPGARAAPGCVGSDQPAFREGQDRRPGHDQVIDDPHIHQR